MRRGPDAAKLEVWRRRLREFERGTETVAAFCRRVSVSVATFYGWRRRVARLAESRMARPGRGPSNSSINGLVSVPSLSFLPVQVTDQPRSVIEVVLAGGTRVLVPSCDRESLRLVLELTAGSASAGVKE